MSGRTSRPSFEVLRLRWPIGPWVSPVCGLTRPCPSDEGDPWPDLPPSRHIKNPAADLPLTPLGPQRCQRSVRVVRQGVPSRAQRKGHERTQEMRREDETRWRPPRCSLSSRRRPPANHPGGPPADNWFSYVRQRWRSADRLIPLADGWRNQTEIEPLRKSVLPMIALIRTGLPAAAT